MSSTSNTSSSSSNSSAKERLQKAFDETVQALRGDVALVMHSAGDTLTDPDPETVQLVTSLTVQYMGQLVDAAVEAREMLHPPGTTTRRRHVPPLPPPPLYPHQPPHAPSSSSNKRHRAEFWDDPLPAPKLRRGDQAATASQHPSPDDWRGVAGVDLWEHSSRRRARAVYVQHAGLTSHPFLFPLCHDPYVYGRIRALQHKKMAEFVPLLQDTVLHETVEAEGLLLLQQQKEQQRRRRKQQTHASTRHHDNKKKQHKDDNEPDNKGKSRDEAGNNSDPEEEDSDSDAGSKSEEESDGPKFPGMDTFLPVYRTFSNPK